MNRDFCYFLGFFGFIDSIFWFIDFLYLGKTLCLGFVFGQLSVSWHDSRKRSFAYRTDPWNIFDRIQKKWDPVKYWNFTGISIFALKSFCEFFRSTYLHPAVTLYKKKRFNQKPFFGGVLAQRSLNGKKKRTFQHWLFIIGQHDLQVLADWYIFSCVYIAITIGYFYIDAINIIASRRKIWEKAKGDRLAWFRHEISWPYTIGHYANINQKRRAFDGFFSCLFQQSTAKKFWRTTDICVCAHLSLSKKFPNWKQLGSSRETFWIE